jgi:dihydrofolate reductase
MSTGAVITGRRTGDFAGYWGGGHHDGVPIFVPTHQAPTDNPFERVHHVTDGIEACVQQAKAAVGDRDVMLHGAYTGQECLKAGVLDVIEIQLRPVLLGKADGCSTTCHRNTSSSTWSAHSKPTELCTCATGAPALDDRPFRGMRRLRT